MDRKIEEGQGEGMVDKGRWKRRGRRGRQGHFSLIPRVSCPLHLREMRIRQKM